MSAFVSGQIIGSPEVEAAMGQYWMNVSFVDKTASRLTLSDTPEALVATLTEALEAVDRAWRASRGEVAL